MRLYHFSNKDLKTLKPDFFGENCYTKNDASFPLKRFFCYDTAKPQEHIFKASNFRYTINIDEKLIYDLDNDILDLKNRFNCDIDDIFSYCKKYYHAISYTTSFKTYVIFKACHVINKEAYVIGKAWK